MARRRSTPCRQKGKKAPPWKFFFCPHSSIVRFGRQVSKAVVAHQLREGGEIGNLQKQELLISVPINNSDPRRHGQNSMCSNVMNQPCQARL